MDKDKDNNIVFKRTKDDAILLKRASPLIGDSPMIMTKTIFCSRG